MDHNSTTTSNFRHCPFFPGKVGPASGRVVFATEQQLLNQATRGCYSTCREARKKLAFILPPPKNIPRSKNSLLSESLYTNPQQKKMCGYTQEPGLMVLCNSSPTTDAKKPPPPPRSSHQPTPHSLCSFLCLFTLELSSHQVPSFAFSLWNIPGLFWIPLALHTPEGKKAQQNFTTHPPPRQALHPQWLQSNIILTLLLKPAKLSFPPRFQLTHSGEGLQPHRC